MILDEGNQRYTGRLKFFDEKKHYGFIYVDQEGTDVFVHFDDLFKGGIGRDLLRSHHQGFVLRVSFDICTYIGKYNKSRKAVEI